MSRIISIEQIKKRASQVKVELSSGEVYLIGFWGLHYVEAPAIYGRVLQHIIDEYEKSGETDLFHYLQEFYARAKDDSLIYVMPEQNSERDRIGRAIRDLRIAKGMEAKKLASMANIDAANISRIEQGKYSVGLDILCRIARALDSRVDIVPIESHIDTGNNMALTRKVWVIPTLDVGFNPMATFPGCGFNLWPNTYKGKINIGDIVVFYMTSERRYADPYIISDTEYQYGQLGKDEWVFPHLAESGDTPFLKICDANLTDYDKVHILEAVKEINAEPAEIIEIRL